MSDLDSGDKTAPAPKAGGRLLLRLVLSACLVVAVVYVMAAGYMYFNQRSFLFVMSGELSTPESHGLEGVLVETVQMADGTDVTVWRAEASDPDAPTVLYLHGNSGNMSGRWGRFKQILDSGYGLYAPSYRGFAGSGGEPSEAALIADALEHFDRLSEDTDAIIAYGESLGTGVATALVLERPDAELLVLEAPYTALVDLAATEYPWLPVNLLMKDPMLTRERIQDVSVPVLIVHGTLDQTVPVEHGRALYALAPDPKELRIIDGAGHGNLWSNGIWGFVRNAYAQVSQRF